MEGCSYPEEQHTHSTCSCDPSQQQAGQISQGVRDSRWQQQQFFSRITSTLPQEKLTEHDEKTQEYRSWEQDFFYTLHVVQINLQTILLLHSGFRLTRQSKMTGSDPNKISFPLPAVQMFGLPKTSQKRDFKIKAFKNNAEEYKKGSHRMKF